MDDDGMAVKLAVSFWTEAEETERKEVFQFLFSFLRFLTLSTTEIWDNFLSGA